MDLPPDRMPEAEVSIRLALALFESGLAQGVIEIGIDGAQVRTGVEVHFALEEFLAELDWEKSEDSGQWQADYCHPLHAARLRVHSKSGVGDVVATLTNGARLRVESKKGPLGQSKSSQQYPLLREALGQILTTEEIQERDVLAVAVPQSRKFSALARRWRKAPLLKATGILILTVTRENVVEGLPKELISSSQAAQP